jgi:hypothetical protein
MVSVDPVRSPSGRSDLVLRCDLCLCLRRGVWRGVVYGSWLFPARMAGGGRAGFEGRPDAKPKLSLGVRSHMLLMRGVRPWTGWLFLSLYTRSDAELGEG